MRNVYQAGSVLKVISIDHDHKAGKRFIDMGITPGTLITVKQVAPLGDPYILTVRNYCLAVRKKDLKAIEVEPVNDKHYQ